MNAAYKEAYLHYRESFSSIFNEEHREERKGIPETAALDDGFSLRSRYYTGTLKGNIHAVIHDIVGEDGTVLLSWTNLDDDGDFCRLIHHRNGKRYLVFREDLYGCSIFCVETGAVFRYLPACVWPDKQEEFQESFIWTDAVYDRESGLLAVTGCFWACPNDVMILDFEDPFTEPEGINGYELMDREYDLYDDIEFSDFQNGKILLKAYNTRDQKQEILAYDTKYLKRLLKERLKAVRMEDAR